jgi:hypothetical protein
MHWKYYEKLPSWDLSLRHQPQAAAKVPSIPQQRMEYHCEPQDFNEAIWINQLSKVMAGPPFFVAKAVDGF